VDDLIPAKEFAKKIGKTNSYVCRLARLAKHANYPWPIKQDPTKRTCPWEAPEKEWHVIYQAFRRVKEAKKKLQQASPVPVPEEKLYCVSEAVEEIKQQFGEKISIYWLSELGNRSIAMGRRWPERIGRSKRAPLDEWVKIMKDEELRAWRRKK
jgi:hypothetical protein